MSGSVKAPKTAKRDDSEFLVAQASETLLAYEFILSGLTPMLMHADDVPQQDELDKWRKDPANKNLSKAGDDRSPAWTWKTYCYAGEMDDGERYLGIPADNIMAALRTAGAQIILKRSKTFKSVTQSGIVVGEFFCPLYVGQEDGGLKLIKASDIDAIGGTFSEHVHACRKLGFDLYVKRAPIGKAKHVRVRPRFNKWEVRGSVQVVAKEITETILLQLFEIAGNYCGLCDWRPASPQSPGPFGKFQARLKRVKLKNKAA